MPSGRLIAFAIAIILVLWLSVWVGAVYFLPNWAERGQFGDMFGAVNALFSGLAFAGLLVTVRLQQKQLSTQQQELKLQREEMASAQKELASQTSAQQALYRATVAQISVAAAVARIESIKMDSAFASPQGRDVFKKEIDAVVAALEALSSKLDRGESTG